MLRGDHEYQLAADEVEPPTDHIIDRVTVKVDDTYPEYVVFRLMAGDELERSVRIPGLLLIELGDTLKVLRNG